MKKFNSYLIDDVKSESEVQVLMEMTELLLKQYEMSNYYYMEDVEPPKDSNPVDQSVTTPQPAAAAAAKTATPTPPTTKPSTPAKQPAGDLTSNPSANNTNTPNQQQKPEEQKGFIGFLKKIGNAISGWVKKIIDFITGGKKKTKDSVNNLDTAVVQATEVVGNDEQSKEKLEELASSNKLDEFLEKMGFKNIDFEKMKKIAIEAITRGTITSVISSELLTLVQTLVVVDGINTAAKNNGQALSTFDKMKIAGEFHTTAWLKKFKYNLDNVVNFVKDAEKETVLNIQQFKDVFTQILDKLDILKPIMEKIKQNAEERANKKETQPGDDNVETTFTTMPDDNEKSDMDQAKDELETCKKTFWLITFIQNIGNAILVLIQHIGDLFKKDKPELHDEDESNILGADHQQPENPQDPQNTPTSQQPENPQDPQNTPTSQPPENPQVSTPPTNAPENPQINTTDNVSQQSQSAPQDIDYSIATDPNLLDSKEYENAHFYNIQEQMDGNISFTDTDEARGTVMVINGKAYPNAYFYKSLRTGQGRGGLEILQNIFDMLDPSGDVINFKKSEGNKPLALVSIIPAEVRENGYGDVDLIKKGKLILK